MKKEICKFVNLELKLRVGCYKFETAFSYFDGWNKIGIMSHIGKMFGLKYGYVEFSLNENLNVYRSLNYYKEIINISGRYEYDPRFILKDRCVAIDNLNRMDLKQFLIRNMDSYNFLTFDESLKVKQLAYLTIGCEIMLENEQFLISNLKDNCEIVCHYWLKGGNPKNVGVSSSDESDEEEDENYLTEEEEEIIENIPEDLDHYDWDWDEFTIDPNKWTGWMNYDPEKMFNWYLIHENEDSDEWDYQLGVARNDVEDKLKKWWSLAKFRHDKSSDYYESKVETTIW
jgi:hypothetical protein